MHRRHIAASIRRSIHRACAPVRMPIETLEGRQLLSVSLNSGVLTLTGGINHDTFTVGVSGSNITVK